MSIKTSSVSSDRWSRASSDSEASIFIGQGDHASDIQRASEIKELLESLAQITGGRDKKGFMFITILKDATHDDVSITDLKKVVLYLASCQSSEEKDIGFSFLVCLKPSHPLGTIKPLTKVLQNYFPYKIQQLYIIKPDGYRERLLSTSSLNSSKYKFDINVITRENLLKYIAVEELTEEFGGSHYFSYPVWFNMRLAFEKFLFESMALSSKLDDIKRSLLQDDFAITVEGVRNQLQHHQHVRKWIVKAPIEILAEEANKVIDIIKNSCECQCEDELRDEHKNSMFQVRGMIGALEDQRTALRELWFTRKSQLEQRFQFNIFKQDAEKMLAWILENRTEFLCNFTEIGEDSEMAKELREEHKQFEENCTDVQANIDHILRVAGNLQEMQFFDVELIDQLAIKLKIEWEKLYMAVVRRSIMLDASVSFHMSSENYLDCSKKWLEELKLIDEKEIATKDVHASLLKLLVTMKSNMTEAYEAVSKEGKDLLSALQRAPVGDSREEKARSRLSDYTEAASHVMDVIVEMYEQNKQLSISLEKQKVRTSQKYKLSLFEQESAKILKFIRGSGNNFLSKNAWVGDQLEMAEELLNEQDEFEKSFQDTYHKAKKLLDTATHLAESKECNPKEIKEKASQLEVEVKTFTSKIKKRRDLLKTAVNFYKSVQKLAKSSDKLKEELNLDGADGSEPQNFDLQLEKHRHECESTLEKILATVHEGETLSSELLQESKSAKEKKKMEQSRQAVEQYLQDLNHNRQNLEKLWHGRQQKLDYWVKVKHYERDTSTLYLDAKKWKSSWQKKELSSDVTKAFSMVERFENECTAISDRFDALFQEGQGLRNMLHECGIEVTITLPDNSKLDSIEHIDCIVHELSLEHTIIKKIHNKLKVKYEFSIKQRKLEADAKKVSGWIRHGESILAASQDAGQSMFEAEALLREYERFHGAIETTRNSVMDVRESANKLIKNEHPDSIKIESIASNIESKWQQLMKHADDRRGVVFSSYNFYRAADQVGKLLDKFSKDCKSEEDPCEKSAEYELKFRREKIEALIKKSEPEKKAVEDGCLKVKECSEEFLKRVLPSGDGDTQPVIDGAIGRLEILVNDLVEQVTSQEEFVLNKIQLRKTVLQGCLEKVEFEENVQQVLSLITNQGTSLSEGLKTLEELKDNKLSEEDKEAYQQKQQEYKTLFEQIRDKIKSLLTDASTLVGRLHFHRGHISEIATSAELRYQDFALHVKKYRELLVNLGCSVPEIMEESDWPSLSAFQLQPADLIARRDVSNDSGIHEMTEEKRRSVKRIEFIINELIQTEKTYVNDLKCCIDNFLTPMYNSPYVPHGLVGKEDEIFGNLELIYEFHSNVFLQELQKYEKSPELVGTCFTDWADKFHMYVEFCANKPNSNSLLIEKGENFFDDLQIKQGLGLSIAAYLIKPVQRITKYQLLLKDLLSCCDDSSNSLQAGLDVMLSVPRRANDAMYLCLIKGFDEGHLDNLGKILLQNTFSVWDTKHILKKGKERHVFLFEQALLFCKEIKNMNGKCTFEYKCKLKTSEMGITEHIAEEKCKFAVWTGEPPFTEEKRVIKAESVEVKNMWVKEIRELTQQFQFGLLKAQSSFYPTSPRRKNRKNTSQADLSVTSDSSFVNERQSVDFETATVCSRTSLDFSKTEAYVATEDYTAKGSNEISLSKGQMIEILSRPPGSKSWRVRVLEGLERDLEGLVPHLVLRKIEDSPLRGKRSSVETLNSQSSEDSFHTDNSPKGSMSSISGGPESKSRRRAKSTSMSQLKMKTWSRGTSKKYGTLQRPPLPTTPTRSKNLSGGGSRKLQAILGAPESDIDLLIRPSDGKYATVGRSASKNAERVKFLAAFDPEDAGFQEGEYDSEGDSNSDQSEASSGLPKADSEMRAKQKRILVLKEIIQSEVDYVKDLELIVLTYLPNMIKRSDIPAELKSKEKVIFGHLPQLFTFHKTVFLKDLQKCESTPDKLAHVFIKSEKKFELYINYCANKPRSSALIQDYLATFFADLSASIEPQINISEYLMKPVQRIMKYHEMLKDFMKLTSRANLSTENLQKALHLMQVIPKKADDVMNVGMLEGFTGNVNNQGKLLMQDTVFVANARLKEPPVERRVFLFEKLVIFSEPFQRKASLFYYIFRHSVQTHTMGLTANYDEDPCKLAIWSKRDSGSSEIYILTARSPMAKKQWVGSIRKIIEDQYEEAKDVTDHEIRQILENYLQASSNFITETHSQSNEVIQELPNGETPPNNQAIDATLQHVKLIPLDQARSLEDLTKNTFPQQESFVVTENYQAQSAVELTVHKNDIVFLVHKKSSHVYQVKCFSKERSGLVPSKILTKSNSNTEKCDTKLGRSSSFGNEKQKKDRSKRSKTISINPSTLLRTASLRRKKDPNKKKIKEGDGSSKNIFDKLKQGHRQSFESSDDDGSKESLTATFQALDGLLQKNSKTAFEIAPEFKILPLDVTVEVADKVRLVCTVVFSPAAQITWLKDEELELTPNDKYNISYQNHLCTFEILSAELSDTGTYTVRAENHLGSASCSAKVTVNNKSKLGVPSKPWIIDVTLNSITLRWDPPIKLKSTPAVQDSYSIEYQEVGSDDWQMAVPVCHDTVGVLDGLETNKTYIFRVNVNNIQEIVGTSEVSDAFKYSLENGSWSSLQPNEIRWKENIEEYYDICGELGRGRFSVVKRCVKKSTNEEFAAKIVRLRMLSKEVVQCEVAILQSLNHPSIVKIYEIYDAHKSLVIVEQLLSGGRLFDHVVIMDLLTEEISIRYIKQLLLALEYLHKHSIAHLDVKPENILLTGGENPTVVLSDFGEAIRLRSVPYQLELTSNPEFVAPEIIQHDMVSLATDMWSVGVVVYVLLSGVSPFYSDNNERACANVTEVRYRFPDDFFSEVTNEAKDFIEDLLVRDQSSRPNPTECLNMPWIKMIEAPCKTRISLSRLAAFNARRRYQYESSSSSVASSALLTPKKTSSTGRR